MKKLLASLIALTSASVQLLAQPVITQPPTNQVLNVGDTLTLSATASDPSAAFQWFKDSRLLLGATNNTYAVANAGVTNSGTYYVVVTNASGMVISLLVLVSVGNPSLLGWGGNLSGELGNGTTNNWVLLPITVASNVVAGAAGSAHSLFVKVDGTLWAMGYNGFGQLGNGKTISTNRPIIIASNVVAGAAGYEHSLFIKSDGTLWAMGYNNSGQLGNGTTNNTSLPVSVASNVVAVAAGYEHSLFIKSDGTLWAMGYNNSGQLGNGTTSNTNKPVSVASNVVAVAAGQYHSLFVKSDETLWAMGTNNYGQLGNFFAGNQSTTPISVTTNVAAVAAGQNHSLFMKADGTLWAMGYNYYGQLGNGTSSQNPNVHPVNVASNVLAVAAGNNHSLFVETDGTLWAMGYNYYGQLGNGTMNASNLPVSASSATVANVFPGDQAYHSLGIGVNHHATVVLGNLSQSCTGDAISASATTTPPGLVVNFTYNGSAPAPTNAGSYAVTATISDPIYVGSVAGTLVVGLPPAISADLTNQAVTQGGTAAFVVAVSGTGPFHYQWQFNGISITNNTITTVATGLNEPISLAFDPFGNLYIADSGKGIYLVDTNSIMSAVNTSSYHNGISPWGITVDSSGNLLIVDGFNNILKMATNGVITTLLTGINPQSRVVFDAMGNLYISEESPGLGYSSSDIRKLDTSGVFSTLCSGFIVPTGMAFNAAGNLFFAIFAQSLVWETDKNGNKINQISVNGNPADVAFDAVGNLFVGVQNPDGVLKMDTNGVITTVASLVKPTGLAFDAAGNLYVAAGNVYELHLAGYPTLTLTNAGMTNGGNYSVVVSSPYGSVTSSVAALTVFLPPQNFTVSSINSGGGTGGQQLVLQLTGTTNYPYILQSATNLTSPINWHPVITNPADANGNWQFTDTNLDNIQKFYRVVGQ